MKVPTYVINLKDSYNRRNYMEKLLSKYPFIKYDFIEAIDGRIMSESSLNNFFDYNACLKRNGRIINSGEVGCVLSHRKCYENIIQTNKEFALILEDDISVVGDINSALTSDIIEIMNSNKPRIIFLSGDYWYWKKNPIVSVFYAVGSYAYLINRAAADIIMNIKKPYNVADDWDLYKKKGIKFYAVHPYVIDANIQDFQSDIQQEYWGIQRKNMSFSNVMRSYIMGIVKRCLLYIGHFESKIRK